MEIVDINYINSQDGYQQYEPKDLSLLNTITIASAFGSDQDYVEYFIYDVNRNLLASNYFVNTYLPTNPDPVTGTYTSMEIDPEGDVRAEGYSRGSIDISYNFFRKLFNSDITKTFWIKEISGDRTELRVCRQDLSNIDLQQAFTDYTNLVALKAYYPDFYLNFGDDVIIIGVNVLFALQDEEGCLLIKLYEPLPDDIELKDTFWIVDKLSDSANFNVNIEVPVEIEIEVDNLRGPNYNIDIVEKVGQTTPLYNYNNIFQTSLSASHQQIKSLMEEKGLDVNIDYTDFTNFIHFSSATERIYNFAYKVQQIESYTSDINTLQAVSSNGGLVSGSKQILQTNINSIIEKFDGYEYYLYYTSASDAWPKSGSTQPYTLYSVTSSQATNWLGGPDIEPSTNVHSIIYSASIYDDMNINGLTNTVPNYLKDDTANTPYITFLNMVGQHFDNIWTYLKDVTERYDAENNLDKGISKDLVGDALRSLGIKLYTNTSISDNLYYSLLAINPDGSLTPPTGSERIDYYIPYAANGLYVIPEYINPDYVQTRTTTPATIPGDDITKEYYKRLYHNVPYLLKTRGTMRGLKALINCFGIPDTILRINEYGGSDKLEATADLVQRRHSLAYYNSGSTSLNLPWLGQNYYYVSGGVRTIVPDTIEFRFKSTGTPNPSHTSQSIFQIGSGITTQVGLNLVYDANYAVPSSSYENYGAMRLFINGAQGYAKTLPIRLPFYDTNLWWNVMIKREVGNNQAQNDSTSNRYWVYAKSTAYDEEGNATLAFQGSQSIFINGAVSSSYNRSWNTFSTASYNSMFAAYLGGTGSNNTLSPNNVAFQGYFQEFRYWATPLSESVFNEHVSNSTSYRGNNPTASLFDLTFRLPLGSNLNVPYLNTSSIAVNKKDYDLYELGIISINNNASLSSYHPAITGTIVLPFNGQQVNGVPSFISGSTTLSYGLFGSTNNKYFQPFEITDLIPTPSTGISQKVNNKVSVSTEDNLTEDLLSPHISIQKFNRSISRNSTDIEVGFAPSDVLDLDISNQLGYFNIDEYIGSPNDAYSASYQSLDSLRDAYFEKYLRKYNVEDFIRLIKYYDNSLFKMIKDFVPARANLSTGIIVKPHILERSKYPRHEPIVTNEANWSSSIDTAYISGSNPEEVYLNTTYTSSTITPLGTVTRIETDLNQPFTGDFGGNRIQATDTSFSQTEVSSIRTSWTSSAQGVNQIFTTYSIDPLQNNVIVDDTSAYRLRVDYTSNPNVPVNLGLITASLLRYPIPPNYTLDTAWPSAEINDYNWVAYSRINPRYEGSRLSSFTYNTYTAINKEWGGDISYGNTAVIDKIKLKYAYIVNIYTPTNQMVGRSNAQIKYLIDNNENTLNLTKVNTNIFDVQNIYKSGETIQIGLFDYDPTNPDVQTLTDNKSVGLYEGGFRYSPVLVRVSGSNALNYTYLSPFFSSSQVPAPSSGIIYPPQANYWAGISPGPYDDDVTCTPTHPYVTQRTNDDNFLLFPVTCSLAYNGTAAVNTYTSTAEVTITVILDNAGPGADIPLTFIIPASTTIGPTSPYKTLITLPMVSKWGAGFTSCYRIKGDYTPSGDNPAITQYQTTTGGFTTLTNYYTSASDFTPDWYAENTTTVRMSATQSFESVYGLAVQTYTGSTFRAPDSTIKTQANIDTPVFSIELYPNDIVKFFSPTANNWVEEEEYRVVNVTLAQSGSSGIYYRYITLDRSLNPIITATGQIPGTIKNYLALKHIPDETNLILRYAPSVAVTQDGLAIPQYIDPIVQANAGNVVQSLKANNLI